jgi:hypothetical protein
LNIPIRNCFYSLKFDYKPDFFLGGKIDAKAAAALIAAAASGGDPEIANKIIEQVNNLNDTPKAINGCLNKV